MGKAFKTLFALALVATVSACGSLDRDVISPGPQAGDLISSSYAAVDRLIANTQAKLDPGKPVLVTSLVDIDDLGASSPLGRLIGEQMVSRLVTSGYSVIQVTLRDSLLVRRGGGQFMLSRDVRDISKSNDAQAVVAGTYAVARDDLFISLRLIRAADGKILSAHDYTIKRDNNISSLAPPSRTHVTSGTY